MDSPNMRLLLNFTMAHSLEENAKFEVHIIRYVYFNMEDLLINENIRILF